MQVGRPEIHATWEPAKLPPDSLVREFEAGMTADVTVAKQPLYGHVSGTLTVSHCNEDHKKKMKLERPRHADLEGYVVMCATTSYCFYMSFSTFQDANPSMPSLSCKTEKDRHIRLNHRTAGTCIRFR